MCTKPTSILDKTDPYVLLKVGGQTFKTRTIADAGKAARWNETFTVPGGLRAGSEGVVEVWYAVATPSSCFARL